MRNAIASWPKTRQHPSQPEPMPIPVPTPDPLVEISRDGIVLGSLPRSEALELLAVGFLKPNDQYRSEGSTELGPLHELARTTAPLEPSTSSEFPLSRPWLGKARSSVSSAAQAVTGAAGQVASRLKSLTTATLHTTARATNLILLGYLPQLRQLLAQLPESRPVVAVRQGIRDEVLMRKVFGALYDCLPRPVCRFMPEERFVRFCMENHAKLLKPNANDPPTSPTSPPPPP